MKPTNQALKWPIPGAGNWPAYKKEKLPQCGAAPFSYGYFYG